MFMTEEQHIHLQESRRRVPRYLFRAFSSGSRGGLGLNNESKILPTETDIALVYNAGEANTKEMIEEHLLWHKCDSAFTSWSSSLIWVLRHAIRKKYTRYREEDVHICILDTDSTSEPIFPAIALIDAYNITPRPEKPWLERHFYFAEYLQLGGITSENASFSVVRFNAMEANGLYDVMPELNTTNERLREDLARAVRDTREQLFPANPSPGDPQTLSSETVRSALLLATMHRPAFVFPVAVAFLSLRDWTHEESLVSRLDAILESLRMYQKPRTFGGEESFGDDLQLHEKYKPKEVASFRSLFWKLTYRNMVRRVQQPADEEQVSALMRGLTLQATPVPASQRTDSE
ncbi:hypothetical protein B0J12DRAFT_263687 [Macrophomina phaseolina]|uniref:DUF7587 domain-containing protein n=1 Tax=Macrophomina phaseolina TaxID=35725 RepID=A0ABQ8FZ78_9PEZI|nr:hypothetical protein B0J12DRAFT_263687 [Macrophomina phaseolina]